MTVIKGRISGEHIAEIHLDGERIAKVLTRQSNHSDQRGADADIRITPGFIDI